MFPNVSYLDTLPVTWSLFCEKENTDRLTEYFITACAMLMLICSIAGMHNYNRSKTTSWLKYGSCGVCRGWRPKEIY